MAIDLETHKVVWTERQHVPITTGILATAGGVWFEGSMDRWLRARDQADGKLLWDMRLNDVPNSAPITYLGGGKQYVAVVVGNGGAIPSTWASLIPEVHNPPDGGGAAVWVFETR